MAVSVWEARRHGLFGKPEQGIYPLSHGITRAVVHADVVARIAAKAMDPLNKMDATRPSDKISEGQVVLEECLAKIQKEIQSSSTISMSPTPQDAAAPEESVNTHSFK